jgi:hypothetical protein
MLSENEVMEILIDAKKDKLSASKMLRALTERSNDTSPSPRYVKCIMKVFDASFEDAVTVLGWSGFGRHISDQSMDRQMAPILYK